MRENLRHFVIVGAIFKLKINLFINTLIFLSGNLYAYITLNQEIGPLIFITFISIAACYH